MLIAFILFWSDSGSSKNTLMRRIPSFSAFSKMTFVLSLFLSPSLHSFTLSFFHPSIHSFFIQPFIHPFIHLYIHSIIHSSTHPPIHSFIYSLIHSTTHPCINSFIHFPGVLLMSEKLGSDKILILIMDAGPGELLLMRLVSVPTVSGRIR